MRITDLLTIKRELGAESVRVSAEHNNGGKRDKIVVKLIWPDAKYAMWFSPEFVEQKGDLLAAHILEKARYFSRTGELLPLMEGE